MNKNLSDPLVTITLPASRFIIEDQDHGGYRAGFCAICEEHGWLDVKPGQSNGIKHKEDCPVGQVLKIGPKS